MGLPGIEFLCKDGTVWTTDKDGIILALLAAEITAKTGNTLSEHYKNLEAKYGSPTYSRLDAPATRNEKTALSSLRPDAVTSTKLAGEPILEKPTEAPGNGASIGGIRMACLPQGTV